MILKLNDDAWNNFEQQFEKGIKGLLERDRMKNKMSMQDFLSSPLADLPVSVDLEAIRRGEGVEFMVNFRKSNSGLPVNVWLDEGKTYEKGGHGYWIKFQTNRQNQWTNSELAVMTISDTPQVIGDHKLSVGVIKVLEAFVIRNKRLLMQLADMKIDFETFIERVV